MGKSKNPNRKQPLLPWLSRLDNGMDMRFLQIGNSLLLCDEFQALSASEKWTYICMGMEAGGHANFKFPQRAFAKYGLSVATTRRAIESLVEKKFIARTSMQNLRKPNEYRFVSYWKRK